MQKSRERATGYGPVGVEEWLHTRAISLRGPGACASKGSFSRGLLLTNRGTLLLVVTGFTAINLALIQYSQAIPIGDSLALSFLCNLASHSTAFLAFIRWNRPFHERVTFE